jgi:hypothetical protein
MTSTDDISQMFDDEFLKLQNLIKIAESNYDLNIHEIVETYYQVMNVSSMSTMLKEQIESQPDSLLNKIQIIDKSISEQFNSNIHPRIMKTLSTSIKETTKKLQSGNTDKKSKEEIESEAKLFEELRQKMSTREFVEQYNKGLYDD